VHYSPSIFTSPFSPILCTVAVLTLTALQILLFEKYMSSECIPTVLSSIHCWDNCQIAIHLLKSMQNSHLYICEPNNRLRVEREFSLVIYIKKKKYTTPVIFFLSQMNTIFISLNVHLKIFILYTLHLNVSLIQVVSRYDITL